MSYTKQTWQTGEVITADKLNHIEDGVENNNNDIIVTYYYEDDYISYLTFDKNSPAPIPYNTIYDLVSDGKHVMVYPYQYNKIPIGGGYFVEIASGGNDQEYLIFTLVYIQNNQLTIRPCYFDPDGTITETSPQVFNFAEINY